MNSRCTRALAAALALGCGGGHATSTAPDAGVAAGSPAGSTPTVRGPPPPPPRPNPVPAENALPGAADWGLHRPAALHEIEGYALAQSALPGDAVPVAVSLKLPMAFRWFAYRLGYYGGAGAREVARGGPLQGAPQPACPLDRTTGLVACGWPPAFQLATAGWPGGLYALKLVRDDGFDTWLPLVLRDPHPSSPVLMIVPSATWQAYNGFGGESLYQDGNAVTGSGRAFQVSYDRPYGMEYGAGYLLRWDARVAGWLEAQGEDVSYATDEDVDRDPSLPAAARAVVLSGHDEYWSGAVRGALDAAVAGGTSLLLFGANAGYWQVRYGPAPDGRARRVVTCYKGDAPRLDPVGPASPDLTVQFRAPPVSRPENALFGVQFRAWNTYGFPLTVTAPDHWALTGTGLAQGDPLPLVGGYEVDDLADNGAEPPGVEVLGQSFLLGIYGGVSSGRMVVRQQGQAVVFAGGGIDFASALSGSDRADPRVQRIAGNVLARALGRDPTALQLVTFGGPQPAPIGPFARQVTLLAGVPLDPGSADGPPATGRLRQPVAVAQLIDGSFGVLDMADGAVRKVDAAGNLGTLTAIGDPPLSTPLGLAADAVGNVYVADTGNGCIRKIDAGGRPSLLAGACGALGTADGPALTARFMAPAGLALRGSALYVADTGANAIRRIDLAAAGTPVTSLAPAVVEPTAVAVAADGTVYATENGNLRVVALAGGQLRAVAGGQAGFADGAAASARLLPQLGLAILPDGSLAVSDPGNYRVRLVKAGQVTTLAGSGRYGGRCGTGDQTDLALPTGLAVDKLGRLLVADAGSSTVRLVLPP